ncbi:MAG: undecaprenyl/decaprenyl-phosphate alpha-N-acetylglucosaminyl 1-phosphate transferase [Clostridiales bacterium]|nr:undecaprenyl/decaprenyl-phosphate alpha-N-acetylglucosaminyl 1-phosphate transferase [Clostridiales bacterium]
MPDVINALTAMLFAALMAFTATPVSMVFAHKIGAIDVPKDNRRMHNHPIPRIGGVAIYFAFALTVLLFCGVNRTVVTILTGGLIIAVMGVVDDVKDLHPLLKLAVQVGVAAATVGAGFRIQFLNVGGTYITFPVWFSWIISMGWIVGMTNAINLIDGLDGLSCGVSMIGSLSLLMIMLTMSPIPPSALIIAILAASCMGFLPFNFYPAKTFMGDTGALFLGYTMAVLSIEGVFKWHAVISFIIPIAVFGYPLFETISSFFRRVLNHKNPFKGDKEHIHHRLINLGFNQKQAVGILYAITGILSLAAVMFTFEKLIQAGVMLIAALVIFIIELRIIKNPVTRVQGGFHLREGVSHEPEKQDAVFTDTSSDIELSADMDYTEGESSQSESSQGQSSQDTDQGHE